MQRPVDECPWRHCREELAFCGLIEELTDVRGSRLSEVSHDACTACCDSFPPTHSDLNPVIASLLFHAAEQILADGGTDGVTPERATELLQLADQNLPAMRDTEDEFGEADDVVWLQPDAAWDSVIPPPAQRCGNPVRTWSVGITTSRRRVPSLERTIESVVASGWERPRLFCDGSVSIPIHWSDLPVSSRNPRTGAWPAWYLALTEMLLRDPHADAYVLFQDDIELPGRGDLRDWLESLLWPGDKPGIVSLYCSSEYRRDEAGWYRFEGDWVWGATAFVYSPDTLRQILLSTELLKHRWDGTGRGLKGIDVAIGAWAAKSDTPIWFPTPSLVQHTGQVSTLWDTARAVANRRASLVVRAAEATDADSAGSRRKFVMLSTGRCGTTLLQHAFAQHSEIRMGGEPFCQDPRQNPFHDIIREEFGFELPPDQMTQEARDVITNPDYLERVFERVDGISIHYWHLGGEFGPVDYYLLHRSDVAIIQLVRRNDFERYVSLQFAFQSKVWHTRLDQDVPEQQTVHIDPQDFAASTARVSRDTDRYREFFGNKLTTVYYEDIVADWDGSMNKLQALMGVPAETLTMQLRKSIRKPLNEIVENYDEVRAYCRGTAAEVYFNAPAADWK